MTQLQEVIDFLLARFSLGLLFLNFGNVDNIDAFVDEDWVLDGFVVVWILVAATAAALAAFRVARAFSGGQFLGACIRAALELALQIFVLKLLQHFFGLDAFVFADGFGRACDVHIKCHRLVFFALAFVAATAAATK